MTGRIYEWMKPVKPGNPNYIPMREAIRQAIVEQGRNPNEIAMKVGLNRFYVRGYLTGDKDEIEAVAAKKILDELKLPVDVMATDGVAHIKRKKEAPAADKKTIPLIGVVGGAGWWEPEVVPSDLPPQPGGPPESQRAFAVVGTDFTDIARPGDVIVTVEAPIVENSYVIVERRRRSEDLRQFLLTRAHIVGDIVELWPMSQNLKAQIAPITFSASDPENVVGIVLKIIKNAG